MIGVIRFENLSFAYEDGPRVFEGLTASIESANSVAILGPNGTGKSTLLHLIAGLLEPNSGRVVLDSVSEPTVGLAPENPDDGLFSGSVREEVAFFPRNRGLPVQAAVNRALDRLGIKDHADRVPQTLSEGEKRLVLLAAVLAGDPDVIALDEPTSGLDIPGRRRLGAELQDLDRTVLFATHDTDFAWRYADRVLILGKGEIHRSGPAKSVLANPDLDTDAVGLRRPAAVRWADAHDFESPPDSAAEAAEWLGGGE